MSTTTATCYKTRSTRVNANNLYRVIPTFRMLLAKINNSISVRDKINWVHKLYIILNANILLICDNKRVADVVYETAIRLRPELITNSTCERELQRAKYATFQMDKFIDYYLDNVWEHDIMLK